MPDPVYVKVIHDLPERPFPADYPRVMRDHRVVFGRGRRATDWEPVERVQRVTLDLEHDDVGSGTVWVASEDGEARSIEFHWYEPSSGDVAVVAEGYCLYLDREPGTDAHAATEAVLDRLRGKAPAEVSDHA